jgi:hypothetical protein
MADKILSRSVRPGAFRPTTASSSRPSAGMCFSRTPPLSPVLTENEKRAETVDWEREEEDEEEPDECSIGDAQIATDKEFHHENPI